MSVFVVLFDLILGDMPTTIIALRRFVEAGIAVEGSPLEGLLQPSLVFFGQITRITGQGKMAAAAVTGAGDQTIHEGHKMVVNPARHLPGAVAQRTGHAHLGSYRFADKGTFVRQLIEKIRQLLFHLERNHRRFRRLLGHDPCPFVINPNTYNDFIGTWRCSQVVDRVALSILATEVGGRG